MRVLVRDPRRSIGVEEGTAKLLKEATVLEWNRDVGQTVFLLSTVFRYKKVIWLTRLGTNVQVAGDGKKETHFCGDSSWRGRVGSIFSLLFYPKERISPIHLSRDPSDAKVLKFAQFLENSGVIVGRDFFFWRSVSQ